jgi:HlyD family secretion protein
MPTRLLRASRAVVRSPRSLVNALLVLLLVVAGTGAWLLLDEDESAAAPATTEVVRGDVVSLVSATGNVTAAEDVGVDFSGGGRLTGVRVSVGDRVRRGDALATVDTADAQEQVDSAEASLRSAQATLRQVTDGPTDADLAARDASVAQAATSVATARRSLRDTRRVAGTARRVAGHQVQRAQRALDEAVADRDRARRDLTARRQDLANAEAREQEACTTGTTTETGPGTVACIQAQAARGAAEQAVSAAEQAVATKEAALPGARDAARSAEQSRTTGNAQRAQSVGTAESSLASARASYGYTVATARQQVQPATDAEVDVAAASVDSALVTLATARRTLRETTLRAPASGTVASVSAAAGEYVGAGGGATATTDAAAEEDGGSASTTSDGFVVLTGIRGLQVEADFSEADVTDLRVGQGASVAFEALDNAGVASGTNATVTAIAPTSVVTDNVVTYLVTATLDDPPGRLRAGQTATLEVVLDEADDAVQVPSSAVTTTGETSTVTVYADGQEEQRTVVVGVVGEATTEILQGLDEGERVVTSSGAGVGGFPSGGLPELPGGGLGGGL